MRTFAVVQLLLEVQFWFPVWLLYLLDLGFNLGVAAAADLVFRVTALACSVPAGILADRIGRRRAFRLLASLTVVTFVLLATITSLTQVLIAWVVWGVLWALASGSSMPYLYELVARDPLPIDVGAAFGFVRAAGHVAVLLSLVAAGYLYEVDPRLPFVVTALLAGVALLLTLRLPEIDGSRARSSVRSTVSAARSALRVPTVRRLTALGVLLLVLGWSPRVLFQPLALDLALPPGPIGLSYAAFAAAGIVGGLLAGRVVVARRVATVVVSGVLLVVACLVVVAAPTLGPPAAIPIMGFAYALAWTLVEVLVHDAAPREVRATILAVVALFGGIGIAVARPGLLLLADRLDATAAFGVWAVVGGGLVAAAAAVARRLTTTNA